MDRRKGFHVAGAAHRVSAGLDSLEELNLVEALVEEVLVVLDYLEAHRVISASAAKVAAFQRRTERRLSDVPAHL